MDVGKNRKPGIQAAEAGIFRLCCRNPGYLAQRFRGVMEKGKGNQSGH